MSKFKVRYFEDAKVVEKEVEATGFYINDSAGRCVIFFKELSQVHAFSDFVSIENIGDG